MLDSGEGVRAVRYCCFLIVKQAMALHQSSKGLCLHHSQPRAHPHTPSVRPVLLTRACGDCERAAWTRSTGLLAAPLHSTPAPQWLARSSSRRSSADGGPAPERQAEPLVSAAAASREAESSESLVRRAEAPDQLSCSGQAQRKAARGGLPLDGTVKEVRGADPSSGAGEHAESSSAGPAAHEPQACSGSGRDVTGGGGQSLDGAVEEVRGRSAAASEAGDFSGSLGVRAALAALYFYKGAQRLLWEACRACAGSLQAPTLVRAPRDKKLPLGMSPHSAFRLSPYVFVE